MLEIYFSKGSMILESVLHNGHGIESRLDELVKQVIWMGWKQLIKTKNLP